MTYTANVPQSGQTLGFTRPIINSNFTRIAVVFANNHVDFNASGEGKHKFLQMPDQSAAPSTALNEAGFYSKSVSGVSQLFFKGENSGSEYQLTKGTSGVDANIATFGTNTSYAADHTGGWTFLPGGLIMQYGVRSNLSSGNNTVTFPRTFPTAVFSIVVTPVRDSSNVDVIYIRSTGTITTANFVMRNTASGISIGHWYAIGN